MQRNVTIDVAATSPTVSQVCQRIGEPTVMKVICAILKLFNDGLNTSVRMEPRQLFEYATIWVEEFPHESLKDLILALKRVKAGRYGKIFNRVDGSVISDFFRLYLEEKAEWRETQNRQQKAEGLQTEQDVLSLLDSETRQGMVKILKKTGVTLDFGNVKSDTQYAEWLRANAKNLPEEILTDVLKKARQKNALEVIDLTARELDRRQKEYADFVEEKAEPET